MEKDSIMEERAARFSYFSEFVRALPAPGTTEEVKNEIKYLSKRMSTLSSEIRSTTETLLALQKEFTFYANYKYSLEKTITPITLITSSPSQRKEKEESLLDILENLSPERQEKLKRFIEEGD